MNSLSWMIYLGDVVGALNPIIGIIIFLSLLIGIPVFVLSSMESDLAFLKNTGKLLLCVAGGSALLSALIPSKETIYLIAASEAGEAGLDNLNPEITKVRPIINNYLDKTRKEDTNDQ